jgi:hypothetical protein
VRKFIWVIAWLCVGLWSALVALGYWLIDVLTGFAANNADKVGGDAETAEFINWFALLLQNIGGIAAVILWAVISLAILAIAWIITRLAPGSSSPQPPASA